MDKNVGYSQGGDLFRHVGVDKEVAEQISAPSVSYLSDTWRRFKSNKLAIAGMIVLLIMVLLSLFGPMMPGYD